MFHNVYGITAFNLFEFGFVLAVGLAAGWNLVRIVLGLILGYLHYRFGVEIVSGEDCDDEDRG